MNLTYLINVIQNKINVLTNAKSQAFSLGDLEQIGVIDRDLLEAQNTLSQLLMLDQMTKAAALANTTTADVVSTGLDAIQNPTPEIQGPSASAIINGYDISAYATDPLYEDKIRKILSGLPNFTLVVDIDNYIQAATPGSPVTGSMVYSAAQLYGVDMPLMLAIMQNDSAFGTLGVGANTFNPGNVGNTGSATHTFPSWQDGVNAVANWLNNHRVVVPTTANQIVAPIVPTPQTDTEATTTLVVAPVTIPIVVPTTPVVATTTNATFLIPTVNASTTPATTTPLVNIIDNSVSSSTATSTATSTPDLITPSVEVEATSTSSTSEATSTDPAVTEFETVLQNSTSTPEVSTSSPQAVRIIRKGKKRRV